MPESGPGSWDIIVIGAGGCGLLAALVAARKGASVLLLEKTDKPGGGTAFSSKGIRAAGTRFQRSDGIEDSPEHYTQDIMSRNGGQSDPALTKRLAETSGPVADFLADVAGIEIIVGEFLFGHSLPRAHTWREDRTVTDFLFEAVQREPNIQVQFSIEVLLLKQETDGSLTGVVTENGTIDARKVILASGGFGASQELLSKYIPKAVGIPFPGHYGSSGEGIEMGLAAGAAVANMGSFQPYPAYLGPEKQSVSPEVVISGGIMVNNHGKRFVDETRYPGGLATGMLDLPDKQAFEILDERVYRLHQTLLEDFLGLGLLHKAQTVRELAGLLGIDAQGLELTVAECDRSAGKSADLFGRRLPAPFEPPFYGIKVKVALYHTQGGLNVNVNGQVLRPDGSIIPNFYAGGGVATGISGTGMDGYLPGNGQLASLGLGMLAGEHAAASLKSKV